MNVSLRRSTVNWTFPFSPAGSDVIWMPHLSAVNFFLRGREAWSVNCSVYTCEACNCQREGENILVVVTHPPLLPLFISPYLLSLWAQIKQTFYWKMNFISNPIISVKEFYHYLHLSIILSLIPRTFFLIFCIDFHPLLCRPAETETELGRKVTWTLNKSSPFHRANKYRQVSVHSYNHSSWQFNMYVVYIWRHSQGEKMHNPIQEDTSRQTRLKSELLWKINRHQGRMGSHFWPYNS